jgi:predicted transcriptional regulator
MPRSERAVLDVLFPEVRAKLLRSFFARPPKQRYVRELVNASGLTLHTVQDELRKLSAVGLLTSWSNGYHRFYRANRDHPMYPKLVAIVQLSETLPRAKSSALARPRTRYAPKTQIRRKSRSLPSDRPASWHLFERQGKARRL